MNRRDMTSGPEWKEILLFSLPIMLGQFLQQLYNTVDGVVVGRYGARRTHELRRAASTLLITLVGLGTFLTIAGSVFARPLVVGLMRVRDPDIIDMAIEYFAIYSLGLIFQYIYNAVAGILRAIGDSRATMYFLIVSAVLNTILDVWFVVSFGWGVVGVAVATVIAQAASAAVSVAYMFIKYPIFRFKKGEFVFDREKFGISLRLGVPAIIQQAVISLGNVFIQRLVNSFDPTTMSAFTVGNRMEAYALVPIFGLNSGVATFTGAQKYDRVHRGWRVSTIMSCVSSVAIALTINLLAGDFARLFNLGGVSMAKAVEYQRYMSYCVVIFAAYMPTSGLLQGAGDAIWASVTSLATLSARVAVSYLLAYAFNVGYASCWLSLPVGWALGIAITYPRYFSKKWMTKRVVRDPLPVSAEEGEEALGLE